MPKRSPSPRCSRTYDGRIDGLGELLALHRAGGVEHDDDVAVHALVDLDLGREEQREVAVLVTLAVGQQARVDEPLAAAEIEAEVLVGRPAVGRLPAERQLVRRPMRSVSRSKPGASAERTSHGHVDVDRHDGVSGTRRHPRPGHLHEGLLAFREQRRRDREAHLALLARRDRERAHLVQVALERAQERRVDEATDDVLVDAGRVVRVEQAAFEGLGSAGEDEIGDRAAGGHREDDAALGIRAAVRADGLESCEPVARDHAAVLRRRSRPRSSSSWATLPTGHQQSTSHGTIGRGSIGSIASWALAVDGRSARRMSIEVRERAVRDIGQVLMRLVGA